MSFELASVVVFLGIIGLLVFIDRKNIEFKYGVFIRRTEKGRESIENFAKRHEKLLGIFAIIAIFAAIASSLVGVYFLLQLPGAKFLLPKVFPGQPSEGVSRYVMFVPIWYWIIAIAVIIVPHELSHGLVAAAEKIKIRSLGIILFLIFPGAFVEPDEKQFQKSRTLTRMKIAAVGSAANLVVFVILLGVVIGLGWLGTKLFDQTGVEIGNTIPNTPAYEHDLRGIITKINDKNVGNLNDLSLAFSSIKPGENITVMTTSGIYDLTTIPNPENSSRAFIGIGNLSTKFEYVNEFKFLGDVSKGVNTYLWVIQLFSWIMFLDLNVAIANLLPFIPFDGGILWYAIFDKFFKERNAKIMITILTVFTYGLLFSNIFLGAIS